MGSDLFLVAGVVVVAFAIPAMISAYADSRPPRVGAIALALGGVMIIHALLDKPGGYTPHEIPEAFVRVIAQVVR